MVPFDPTGLNLKLFFQDIPNGYQIWFAQHPLRKYCHLRVPGTGSVVGAAIKFLDPLSAEIASAYKPCSSPERAIMALRLWLPAQCTGVCQGPRLARLADLRPC